MDKIDKLIAFLFAIQAFSKDIHYSAKGEAFYSKHLLADEIYKGIDEQIDALIETCILPSGYIPKRIFDYQKMASAFGSNFQTDWEDSSFEILKNVLDAVLCFIQKEFQNSIGANKALIDNIAQDLQRKLGLITRQVG